MIYFEEFYVPFPNLSLYSGQGITAKYYLLTIFLREHYEIFEYTNSLDFLHHLDL